MILFFQKSRKSRFLREQGFTLIELLVVILIIGILAAIAVPMFLNQRKSAADAALKSDIKNLATAIETWQTTTGDLLSEAPIPEYPPGQYEDGYVIIIRDNGTAPFAGANNGATSQSVPDGMDMPSVSDGVGLGVMARAGATGGEGYCILGNNEGGNYYRGLSDGVYNHYRRTIYYDSTAGGLFTAQDLPSDGSCRSYWQSMDANGGTEYP